MVNYNQFLQWWAAPWIQTSGAPRCIFLPSPPPRQHEGAAGQASTRWGRIFESSLNCFLLPVTGAESDKSSILLLRLQKEDGGFIWTHSVLQVTTMLHILPCYIHHDQNPYNNDHQWRFTNSPSLSWFQLRDAVEESATPVIILTNQILSIEEAAVWSSPTPTLSSANHHYPQHFCYYKTNQGHARQLLAVPLLHGSEPPAVRSCLWGSLAGCPLIPLLPSCCFPVLWAKSCQLTPSLPAGCPASLSTLRLFSTCSILSLPSTKPHTHPTPFWYQRPLAGAPGLQQESPWLGEQWKQGKTGGDPTLGLPATSRPVFKISQLEIWFLRVSSWATGRWRWLPRSFSATGWGSTLHTNMVTWDFSWAGQTEEGGAGGVHQRPQQQPSLPLVIAPSLL